MKICGRHSHDMLHALRRRGMQKLIRPEDSVTFAKRWLEGLATKPEFDPFVVATLEIFKKCHDMSIYVLEGGCPLCAVNVAFQKNDADASWIDNVSDLMLLTAQTNRLVTVSA